MKAAETKSVAKPAKANTPFFQKGSEAGVLSDTGTPPPFFQKQDNDAFYVQTKLTIGQPNDKYEQEADMMADKVVQRLGNDKTAHEPPVGKPEQTALQTKTLTSIRSTPAPHTLQTKCATCGEEEKLQKKEEQAEGGLLKDRLRRKPIFESNGEPTDHAGEPAIQKKCEACEQEEKGIRRSSDEPTSEVGSSSLENRLMETKGSGSPLPGQTRKEMEGALGADFSGVRVHDNSGAAQMNKDLNAQAFAHGNDIYFNSGKYDPNSTGGKHLLAHELTHTIQQGGSKIQQKSESAQQSVQHITGNTPKVQASWYNFNIPFTDYQFDPSIEGIKNAGNMAYEGAKSGVKYVEDKVEAGLDWIVDKVRGLVNKGIDWLKDKWESLKTAAKAGLDGVTSFFKSFTSLLATPFAGVFQAINELNGELLSAAWNGFTGFVNHIWTGFKETALGVIDGVLAFFTKITDGVAAILSDINSVTQNSLFSKLPAALQDVVKGLVDSITSIWKTIQDEWENLKKSIKESIKTILDTVETFVKRILSFVISVIVQGFILFGKLVMTLFDFFKNPNKYLDPLAAKIANYLKPVEAGFAGTIGKYFGSGPKAEEKASAPATQHIKRKPEPGAATAPRSKASWSAIGKGILDVMKQKWAEFKKNPLGLVKSLLLDLFVPMYGNIQDLITLFKEIKKIVTKPLSASSLEEFWTSLLKIIDIPILILHTIVSILGRSLMLPLLIASFIPHPLVKAVAVAVGGALLEAFVGVELLNVGHKVLLLKTGLNDDEEKKDAYNRIADSAIALAMAAVIAILIFIISVIAQIAKSIFNFVKGKFVTPKEIPIETDTAGGGAKETPSKETPSKETPTEESPSEKGNKTEPKPNEGEKGTASKDGDRDLKMNEEGKCEVCASPCDDIRKKYAKQMTSATEAEISAIENNKALSKAEQLSKLKEIEQRLANEKATAEATAGSETAKKLGYPEAPEGHHWVAKSDGGVRLQRNPGFKGKLLEYDPAAPKKDGIPAGFKEAEGSYMSEREQNLPKPLQRRVDLSNGTKAEILRRAKTTVDANGETRWVDGKTGKTIPGEKETIHPDTGQKVKGDFAFGHKDGDIAWKKYQDDPANQGKTREQVIADQDDPSLYRVEEARSNSQAGAKGNAEDK